MAQARVLPYGSWPSPISIEMAVAGSLALREPRLEGEDVYWIEGRPEEAGRQVIVRWNESQGRGDVTPAGFNARTTAHEYGGGTYAVRGGTLYFSNMDDGRLYRQLRGSDKPEALTPEGPYRFADMTVDRTRSRLIAVLEDHSPVVDSLRAEADGGHAPEPENSLVAIDLDAGGPEPIEPRELASGYDFYSTPRLSPAGDQLAWLCWRHPNMPWDGTELWLADLTPTGTLQAARQLAGGSDESIVQPEWAPDGSLVFASDRSGWWNLYRLPADQLAADVKRPTARTLFARKAEFAGAQWVFGMSWYGIAPDGTIVAIARSAGRDELWLLAADGRAEQLAVPDTDLSSVIVGPRQVIYLGASSTEPASVVFIELDSAERRILRRSSKIEVDPAYLSRPRPISFPTAAGQSAHALYYPPTNPDARAPATEEPPLIVMSHGGPTSHASSSLDLGRQVFTSRGFAVVDVDYGGSTGYGREYMRRLDGQWGIVDVQDCIAAARYLAGQGEADEKRLAIRGGSAGGYTTLCALVFHDVFAAGASYFGVGDLEALARDTHKFESRYLDRLVAPYPEGVDIYRDRSPIHFMDQLDCALIVLQGRDDKVVPVDQAETLVAALRARGLPHAYLCFDGEGHGFRQANNISRSLEAELSFYAQVFGFELADELEAVSIA